MPKLQNIIFDLGNVIIDVEEQQSLDAIRVLGVANIVQLYDPARRHRLFIEFELGRISPPAFIRNLRGMAGLSVPTRALRKAWNAMLGDIPEARMSVLRQVRQYYRTFLLSNTNHYHLLAINALLRKKHGVRSFAGLFEKEYYSHMIGMRKPDPQVFELVLEDNGLLAAATLFVDDNRENIQAARQLGIQTLHLANGQELSEALPAFLPA